MGRPAERCEEEDTPNNETTNGLIGFPTENYLAKQRHEHVPLCMQVYMLGWFCVGVYAMIKLLTSFP